MVWCSPEGASRHSAGGGTPKATFVTLRSRFVAAVGYQRIEPYRFVPAIGPGRGSRFACFPDTRRRNGFPNRSLVPSVLPALRYRGWHSGSVGYWYGARAWASGAQFVSEYRGSGRIAHPMPEPGSNTRIEHPDRTPGPNARTECPDRIPGSNSRIECPDRTPDRTPDPTPAHWTGQQCVLNR